MVLKIMSAISILLTKLSVCPIPSDCNEVMKWFDTIDAINQKGLKTMKKSMMKRIAVCVSAAAMLTSFSATLASAATVGGNYAKVSNSASVVTKAEKNKIAAKTAAAAKANAAAAKANAGKAAYKISIPGTFGMYQQEKDDYCCDACIKSVLMYTAKTSPSQATIHKTINLDFSKIPAYVNARESQCYYVFVTSPSLTSLKDKIYYDINTEKTPSFLRIYNLTGANWYYATAGHCVLSNAIYSDKSIIQIADPLGGRVSGCPYYYLKNATVVGNYTTHICW